MTYWFRTILGLLFFFGSSAAFDYSVFELIAEDAEDANRLVAAIPLGVIGALAGGALFSGRGAAPWHVEEPPGWSFAVPWWCAFFVSAGAASLAAGVGLGGGPDGTTPLTGVLVGLIFAGLGLAPILLGLTPQPPRAKGGTAATRIAAMCGQGFIALLAVTLTLALMDSVRDDPPPKPAPVQPEALPPVAPDAPESLFREAALGPALEELARQAPGELGIQRMRVDPNSIRAQLEVETGTLRVVLDRAAEVAAREDGEPVPEASFALGRLDPGVCERIARAVERSGGPGIEGIGEMVATGEGADGRPGWKVYAADPEQGPWNATLDGRLLPR